MRQLLVRSPKGDNKPTELLHGTSIFDVRLALPPAADIEVKNGLRANFPALHGRPRNAKSYLKKVDDLYAIDAYNSLSIEGYRVCAEHFALFTSIHTRTETAAWAAS